MELVVIGASSQLWMAPTNKTNLHVLKCSIKANDVEYIYAEKNKQQR
jgi:hypothetical protein